MFCNLLNFETELSKTITDEPSPIAVLHAYSPTVPAPITTTLVGIMPEIPPSINPFPLFTLDKYSPAINNEVLPAISLILLTIGNLS